MVAGSLGPRLQPSRATGDASRWRRPVAPMVTATAMPAGDGDR
ncbi:hypothetical protein [Thermaerobacter litoralis]